LILKTIALGKQLGKPVAAAGNARLILGMNCHPYRILKDETVPYLFDGRQMLNYFPFLEEDLAEEIVIHAPNRLADLCEEIRIFPENERQLQPILPGTFQTISFLCTHYVMERVCKGKGLNKECISALIQHEVPEWFIKSCDKIRYLFPKAHCAALYTIPALKAAWYKAHFPKEYSQAYAESYED